MFHSEAYELSERIKAERSDLDVYPDCTLDYDGDGNVVDETWFVSVDYGNWGERGYLSEWVYDWKDWEAVRNKFPRP